MELLRAASINGMNRSQRIDSEVSLDVIEFTDHCPGMATHMFTLHCQRIDETLRMRRYYILSLQATLFGDIAITRCWGRIGSRGQEKADLFATEEDAIRHFLELARSKRKRGYRPALTIEPI